jgi:hypothetical protein
MRDAVTLRTSADVEAVRRGYRGIFSVDFERASYSVLLLLLLLLLSLHIQPLRRACTACPDGSPTFLGCIASCHE